MLDGVSDDRAWEIRRFGTGASTLVHVPHAASVVPAGVRGRILLDDGRLAAELAAMTDWHTDTLALRAAESAACPSVVFRNRLSRLVVDPERFPDEREVMAKVGMGAVYQATSTLEPLRHADPGDDARLLECYFYPYAEACADLVDELLADAGRCVIVDVHSYPTHPLPYELDQRAARPAVCIGTDPEHTPRRLHDLADDVFVGVAGGVGENTPFAGAYVPLRHYGRDKRVSSIMIELRRDSYLDGPSELAPSRAEGMIRRLARLLDGISGASRKA